MVKFRQSLFWRMDMKKLGLLIGFVIVWSSVWGCAGGDSAAQILEDTSTPIPPTGTDVSTGTTTLTPTETIAPTGTPTAETVKITVTFKGDQCLLHGPKNLPPGDIMFSLDVQKQIFPRRSYGYAVYSVDEGKTLKDLMAATFIPNEPTWAYKQAIFEEVERGSYQEKSAMISDGPIFLVCVVKDGENVRKTNVIGPIKVESQISGKKDVETSEMPDEWDMIFFSDSTGWDVAQKYAIHIENDLGVSVNIRDNAFSGLSIRELLDRLERNEFLLDHLAESEVVVIIANAAESVSEANPGNWSCVTPKYQVTNCDLETFDQYIEDLSIFYEKVFELRDGQPTIIRAFNAYVPIYSTWIKEGVFDECRQCWLNFNEAIEIAADKFNVPVAPVFEAFNGVNYDEDPREKGYISSDGEHTTSEGSQVIADTLRLLGYDITHPPE
jgi:hypothetical protein